MGSEWKCSPEEKKIIRSRNCALMLSCLVIMFLLLQVTLSNFSFSFLFFKLAHCNKHNLFSFLISFPKKHIFKTVKIFLSIRIPYLIVKN